MRFLLGLLAGAIWAASLPPLKFTDTHLANGLRVIISEDHAAPVVAVSVTYAVGAKDERPGRTGFAHLFEHMMFKGSENVGGGEHFYHIFSNGGVMNGSTSKDRTNYFELLPKNQLDLALFLESDRMRSLAITKENLENQRQAVKEERRLNYDNRPYGLIYEKASELVYQNFPYKHVPIGSMEDLDAASVDDVKQFFQTYYAPNNANLAIVGDVDTKSTLEKVKKYFGDIPRQEAPKRPDLAEPVQAAEKRIIINDKLARLPRVDVFYKAAPATSKDFAVLTVIDELLGTGESSRLYQKLVKETESAVQANSTRMGHVGPGLFGVTAIVPPRGNIERVEGLISEEISRLQSEPVSDKELRRIKTRLRLDAVNGRRSAMRLANQLSGDAAMYNNPNRINTELDELLAVTPAQIMEVAKTYLKSSNRNILVTMPQPPAERRRPAGAGAKQ